MALNMTTPPTSTTRSSQLNLLGDSITFKVQSKEHSETRLFLLPRQFASFQAVVARIVELFGFQNEQQLQVQYTDDENDLVTITTDEELRSALQLFSGRPSLRLIVSVRKNCSTIQVASEPKAFEGITIEPDHAESVVNCNKFAGDSNTTSSDQPSVTLEEASEKLADFVVPASIDTSPVVGVKEVADEVPTTTISSTRSVSDLESSKDCKPALVIGAGEPKRILTKEERIKMREARLAVKAKRESMAAGLKQLEELGFAAQRGHCIRLLLKYEGDVDQVIQEMKAWAQAKEAREKLKLERQEKKKLKEEYKAKKALVLSQKKELIEEKKKRREMMAERKKLKEDLKQERCLKKAEMLEKKKLMKEQRLLKKKVTNAIGADEDPAFEEFKPQLAQLEAMGFKCKHRNVRLLKKFDGEVTKVIDLIAFKEAERLQAYAEKHGIAEYEAAHKAAFEKLAGLGYDDKRLNVRLLKQFDGDVDKAILHLRIIDEKKRHRAEMAKLLAAAQPQPQIQQQLPVATQPQQQQQQSVIVN